MLSIDTIKSKYRLRDVSPYADSSFLESLAMSYHENSKFSFWDAMQQGIKAEQHNNPYINSRASKPYKIYPGVPTIQLSRYAGFKPGHTDLFELLQNRRTTRQFQPYQISLNELQQLLHHAYGITQRVTEPVVEGELPIEWGWRTVPSAGGLYPLEIYPVLINAQVPAGLYHYRADCNALEVLNENLDFERFEQVSNASNFINAPEASLALIITGVFERTFIKYQERGYRFVLQESGEVLQNLSILSEALGLGSCIIGGFLDEGVNEVLGIDGVFESTLGVIYIGKK